MLGQSSLDTVRRGLASLDESYRKSISSPDHVRRSNGQSQEALSQLAKLTGIAMSLLEDSLEQVMPLAQESIAAAQLEGSVFKAEAHPARSSEALFPGISITERSSVEKILQAFTEPKVSEVYLNAVRRSPEPPMPTTEGVLATMIASLELAAKGYEAFPTFLLSTVSPGGQPIATENDRRGLVAALAAQRQQLEAISKNPSAMAKIETELATTATNQVIETSIRLGKIDYLVSARALVADLGLGPLQDSSIQKISEALKSADERHLWDLEQISSIRSAPLSIAYVIAKELEVSLIRLGELKSQLAAVPRS